MCLFILFITAWLLIVINVAWWGSYVSLTFFWGSWLFIAWRFSKSYSCIQGCASLVQQQVPGLSDTGVSLTPRRHHFFQQPKSPCPMPFAGSHSLSMGELCWRAAVSLCGWFQELLRVHIIPPMCSKDSPNPESFCCAPKIIPGVPVNGCSKELLEEAIFFFRAKPERLLSIVLHAANVVLLLLGPDLVSLCAAVDAFTHLELVQGSLMGLCTAWPRCAQHDTIPCTGRAGLSHCSRLGGLGNRASSMLCLVLEFGSCGALSDGGRDTPVVPITTQAMDFFMLCCGIALCTQSTSAQALVCRGCGELWVIPHCSLMRNPAGSKLEMDKDGFGIYLSLHCWAWESCSQNNEC